ncbi:LOW QUALITY PROTEIN: hypothetical protein CRUP_019895, partial [Coryphaenoides rupestris]
GPWNVTLNCPDVVVRWVPSTFSCLASCTLDVDCTIQFKGGFPAGTHSSTYENVLEWTPSSVSGSFQNLTCVVENTAARRSVQATKMVEVKDQMLPSAGATGLGVWGRLGLCPPPPSLSVLEEDGGRGGGSLGRGTEEGGGIRVEMVDPELPSPRRLWILRHSWQMRTWLQPRAGSMAGPGFGGGGVVLAPIGNSRIRWGPGPSCRPFCSSSTSTSTSTTSPFPGSAHQGPRSACRGPSSASFPLLRRISRTRRRGLGAPRATRLGWRRAAELEAGLRRRERELFLQETAFRNSVWGRTSSLSADRRVDHTNSMMATNTAMISHR